MISNKTHFNSYLSFLIVIVFFSLNANSQENKIVIDSIFRIEKNIKINEAIDLVILTKTSPKPDALYKLDKSQNTFEELIDLDFGYLGNTSEYLGNELGLFLSTYTYINGNTLRYNIHWIDLNGNRISSPLISTKPKLLGVRSGHLYYTHERPTGGMALQKFNLSTGTISNIHYFLEEIEHFQQINGVDYFVLRDNPNQFDFFSYTPISGMVLEFSIPSTNNHIIFLEEHNNLHYFHVLTYGTYSSTGIYDIWEVDFNQKSAQLFKELPRYFEINIAENSLYYSYYQEYFRASLSTPNQIDTIHFSKELATYGAIMEDQVNSKLARGYTFKHGFEPFYIADSIYLLKDYGKGIQSGWINRNYGMSFDYSENPFFIENHGLDSCFTIMTNFNDNLNYLYSIEDTTIQSYFPIDDLRYIKKTGVYNDNFYWWTDKNYTLTIHWRSLKNNLSPQPDIKNDTTPLTWGINLNYVHERRFYVQNDRQQNAQIKLLKDGGVLSSVRMANAGEYKIADEEYNIIDDAYGSFLVYKHDSTGKLAWHKSFGPKHFGGWADNPLLVDIDKNEDVYVSGVFFEDYHAGNDSLEINRVANFMHKLDGETGETIWFKIISQNFYYDDFHIDKLKIINNEIVITFSYEGFNCKIDGFQLNKDLSGSMNALAKFDLEGNLIYAKNIPTDWTTGWGGNTWILDDYNGQLFASQSEGAYNISSSCEFDKWGYFNQIIDVNGEIERTISLKSSDIGAATTGFFEDNNIFAFGRYRGELDLGYFNNITPFGENCNLSRGFMYRYDLEKDEFSELKISFEEFYPFDAKYLGNFYYVYGRGENKELTIVKFDKSGKEIGYKRLGQYLDDLTYNAYQFFDVSDEYIAIIGDNFESNTEFEVPRKSGTHRYTTVIKTLNDNWSNDKKLFENKERIFTSDINDDLVVYPNPFTGEFSIMFKDPIYTDLEIYNLNGKQLKKFQLSDAFVQKFEFENIPDGIYLFKIFNNETSKTIKMVKQ